MPTDSFFCPSPSNLLSTQLDGSRENSIALFLIVKAIFIGLTKMPFIILPRLARRTKIAFELTTDMRKTKRNPVTVGFVALGCPKNMVDSEKMLAHLAEAGYLIAAEPEQADVVVINTCGFIEPATFESLKAVEQAIANKKMGKVQKVIVAGCLAQRLGEQLLDRVADV